MSTQRLFQVVTFAAASLVALGACTINIGIGGSGSGFGHHGNQFSDSDIAQQRDLMFAQMMIPHHEQAIVMGELALANSRNDAVRDLAQRIIDGQSPEIAIMQVWLDDAGIQGFDGGHGAHGMAGDEGMMMGGMASDEELEELESLTSPEFDTEFLRLMIEHHEGALVMVRMITQSTNEEARVLARDIIAVQRAEIIEMEELLELLTNA
jgi:uncharacterized protein (DUF305 family)